MSYEINIPEFEGPLDLLLHLIKKDNININDININDIIEQYFNYINKMERLNLNIASEYLVMAAELLEIKSCSLLPKAEMQEDEYEEDPKQNLINKLLEYEQYKKITEDFKNMEEKRLEIYTREPNSLSEFKDDNETTDYGIDINDLLNAFSKFLEQKQAEKPLNTKITNKEYSITKRCCEIKKIIKDRKKINFIDLFENYNKEYIVITFLSILSLVRKQEIDIEQKENFQNIIVKEKGVK